MLLLSLCKNVGVTVIIVDKVTVGIPGATGDVTPALTQLRNQAQAAQSAAASSANTANAAASRAQAAASKAEGVATAIDPVTVNQRFSAIESRLNSKADLSGGKVNSSQLPTSTGTTSGTIPLRDSGGRLPGVAEPSSSTDAANKSYVDRVVAAVPRPPVKVDTGWHNLILSSGWTGVANHIPRARFVDGVLYVEGAVRRNAGGALTSFATLPPAVKSRITARAKDAFVGAFCALHTNGSRAFGELYLTTTNGVIATGDYTTLDGNAGWVIPITFSFIGDL